MSTEATYALTIEAGCYSEIEHLLNHIYLIDSHVFEYFDEYGNSSGNGYTWRNRDKVLLEASKGYSQNVICIECEYPEYMEFERVYYKDGKMITCPGQVMYEKFDIKDFE